MTICFTSDLHFGHDRQFMYVPRGFNNIHDHDKSIISNWNSIVQDEDLIYILGDIMLGDNSYGCSCFNQLKGRKEIILGNHDSAARVELYSNLRGVMGIKYADILKYNGYHFFLCHYPTYTANLEKESLKRCLINLYGHTHQKTNFYNDIPFMYHVGVDSHNNTPVNVDQIILDVENKAKECFDKL